MRRLRNSARADSALPSNTIFANRRAWGEDGASYFTPIARLIAGVVAIAVVALGLSIVPSAPAQAAVVQWGTNSGTAPNYQATVNGDYILVGNGVLACAAIPNYSAGQGTCDQLHGAANVSTENVNDNFNMVNSNTVSGFATNSSSASITIPSGASVRRAFLNWSANTGVRTGETRTVCAAYSADRGVASLPAGTATAYRTQSVQLRVGTGAVTSVAPGSMLEDPTTTPTSPLYYSAGADVTAAFTGATTGSAITISAGNLWAPTGPGCYAGWSIAVVYDYGTFIPTNTNSVPHRIIYYEGHVREASTDQPLTVAFTGFTAVGTGTRAGFTLFEGDRGIVGDTVSYSRGGSTAYTEIPNAAGATGNFGIGRAEGSIRYTQTSNATAFTNQSVDVTNSSLSNVVSGDTAVNLRVGTTGDSYLLRNAILSVPTAGIQIDKTYDGTVDTQSRTSTEPATFTIKITNTGAGTLQNIQVLDDQPNCARTLSGVTLLPLASTTYTCTAAAGAGASYTSTATVNAYTAVGGFLATDNDTTEIVYTAIGLTKSSALAAGSTGRAGDTVNYTFVATNTGASPLTGVAITDPLAGLSPLTYAWPGTAGALSAGQSVTATATYVLKQADVDAGSIANTATTTGTDNDGGLKPTATATNTTSIASAGALAVTKSGVLAAGATGRVGDVINYTFTIRNTGNVTLTNGTLTDPLPGLSPPSITWPTSTAGTLAPNATATATASYTIKQSDVDAGSVKNTATATGRTPTGTTITAASPQSTVATIASSPSMTTTKSSAYTTGSGAVGSVITYTFRATNTGNVTLTGVAINDPLVGLSARTYTWPGTAGTLAPGQFVTATATYTLTQADVDRGTVVNTATTTATSPTGTAVSAPSPTVTTATAASAPAITLTKSGALTGTGRANDTVTYSFTLINSGNVTLTGVGITDPLAGLSTISYGTWPSGTAGTLAPGQQVSATATYVVKQSDVDAGSIANTATATGKPPTGANVTQQRSATVRITAAPTISISKTGALAAGATGRVGETVNYSFTVTNTGNVTLTGVAITDPLSGLSTPQVTWPGTAGTLAPGAVATATATYTIRQSDVDAGSIKNTASVTGKPPTGANATASSAQVTVATAAAAPSIATTKSAAYTSGTGAVGSVITYTFVARNSGNVTLTGVAITDPLTGLSAINYGAWPSGTVGTLTPGQTVTATATYTLTQADVDRGSVVNTASSTGKPPTGANVTGASAQVSTSTAAAAPSVAVSKSGALAAGSTGVAGNTLNYSFTLRNNGNVTLTGSTITDLLSGLSAITYGAWPSGTVGTLAPGQTVTATATYTLKQSDVDAGSVANTATGAGTSPTNVRVTNTAAATVPLASAPALLVTKSGTAAAPGGVGSVITYSFSARNTGNVTLTGVAITDPLPRLSAVAYGTWPSGTSGTLAPGQTITATATYTIIQADIDAGAVRNTATATGTPPTGPAITASSPQSTVTTAAASPSLVTTKSAAYTTGSGAVGSVITYTFTARNSGNVTLAGVAVTDPLVGLSARTYTWPGAVGTLAPGQTVTATATYTVTQADVDGGSIRNTATATGTPPTGAAITAASQQVTTATAASAPAVTLTKSGALTGTGRAGDTVTYSFTLTNSGNVTLTQAGIADPLSGLSAIGYGTWPSGTAGTLAPGQQVSATATYVVKQSDVDAGSIANTATATGKPPTGANVSQQRSATVLIASAGSLTVTKSGTPNGGAAGSTITYSFRIENTGNVTLNQVTLADSKAGVSVPTITWPGTAGTLSPGQFATATATYTVTQADVDAGVIRNTATTTGRTPTGATVTATSAEASNTTAAAAPAITTAKTGAIAPGETGVAGGTIQYTFVTTNAGNVTLTGVGVTDTLTGLGPITYGTWPSGTTGTLRPGQSVTSTANYRITQADVDAGRVLNTATSSGTTPAGAVTTGASPQTSTATQAAAPSIVFTKSGTFAPGSTGVAGDTVRYSFSIRNSGNVTLTGVGATDPLPDLSAIVYGTWPSGTTGTLAPGQTVTATATYVVKQTDVDAGAVANTATASATPPTGAAITQARSATVPISATPSLAVTKTGSITSGTGNAQSVITYTFTLRNTGNVTLSSVSLTDSKAGVSAPVISWPGTAGVLAPGARATATATYTVTQPDVDAGSVRNTAAANGTTPGGAAVTASSAESVVSTAASAPSITTAKSAAYTTGTGAVGSVITYTFTVRNTGNVTLRGVAVADPLPRLSTITYSTWPGAPNVLPPGTQVTATATYTVTQADVDAGVVRNTATSTGTPPTGAAVTGASPTVTTSTVAQRPAITFTKDATLTGTGRAQDTIGYSFSIENTGNVTLSSVGITDRLSGISAITFGTWPTTTGVLAPGERITASASYTVKQSDVDAGSVANTATASGNPQVGAAVTQSQSASVVFTPAPVLAVTKAGTIRTPGTGRVGDVIDYTFSIGNPGNVTVSGIVLNDRKAGISTPAITWPGAAGVLAPDQTATASATYTITQADVDAGSVRNVASVVGRSPAGAEVTASSAESVVTTTAAAPSISTTKSGVYSTGSGNVGDLIRYTFITTNTGNVTLTGVNVTDPLPGLTTVLYQSWPGPVGTLAPGQSVESRAGHTVTQADVDRGIIRNIATSTGTTPAGGTVSAPSPQFSIATTAANPVVTLVKTGSLAAGATGVAGDRVDFSFVMRNAGNVTLTGAAITDALTGVTGLTYGTWPAAVGTLAPGQQVTATARYALLQSDVDAGSVVNTASATATTPTGGTTSGSGAVTVAVPYGAALTVAKSGALVSGTGGAGSVVRFTITVRNSGNATLRQIAVTDSLDGLSALTFGAWPSGESGVLSPGQFVTATADYVVRQADANTGTVTNSATAVGTPSTGAPVTATSPAATVTLNPDLPSITTTKTGVVTTNRGVDGVVTFTIEARNTGGVTLTGVTIADPGPGLSPLVYSWPDAANPGTLMPREVVTATTTHTIVQADVDAGFVSNTATATGTPPTGPAVSDASDEAVVPTVAQNATVLVTHGGTLRSGTSAGNLVDWTYALENTGNVTLTGVTLSDPLPGLTGFTYTWPGAVGVLAPGQKVTATATYALRQADVDAGAVTSTVTGSGTPPRGAAAAGSAPATVTIASAPSVSVQKTGAIRDQAPGVAGNIVDYSFTISNTGNVTLNQLIVTDSLPGVSAPVITWPGATRVLAPGQVATGTATYTITQADVDAGIIRNTASISGLTPNGAAITRSSNTDERTLATAAPGILVTKSATVRGTGSVTDSIAYAFTIRNTGNVTLTGVRLSDTLDGLSTPEITWPGAAGTLTPGQTATATAGYAITQSDVDRGAVTNVASATGVPARGTAPTSTTAPVVSSTVAQNPAYTFTKSGSLAAGQSPAAGSRIDYRFEISNTGNQTLTGVVITDLQPGLTGLAYAWPGTPQTLAPGETVTATASKIVNQADVDAGSVVNSANAVATTPRAGALSRPASATVPLAPTAAISVTKSGVIAAGTGNAGSRIDYTFVVRNAGTVTLGSIGITDALAGVSAPVIAWPDAGRTLAPGQAVTATASYTITQTDVDAGVVRNTATVSGTPPRSATPVTGTSAESIVSTAAAAPRIETTKTAVRGGTGVVDDTITYSFRAENTGNVTLTGVAIADPLPRLGTLTYGTWPGVEGTLRPGQAVTATAIYTIDQADVNAGRVLNTATSTGTSPAGATATDASDPVTVQTVASTRSIDVRHSGVLAPGSTGIAGNIVQWSYALENTGNVTLTDVNLTDPQPRQYDFTYTWPGPIGVLQPGQTVTATSRYALTQDDVDAGSVTTIVSGSATPPTGARLTGSAPATVTVGARPALSVLKSGTVRAPGTGLAGDTIDYRFQIDNPGNVTLTLVTLVDALSGVTDPVFTWPGAAGVLPPGTTAFATATYTITQADVDSNAVFNAATVTGKPPTGPDISTSSQLSTVTAEPARNSIETTKSASRGGTGALGDIITYTFTAQNTGNRTLTGVSIADNLPGLSPLAYTWPTQTAGRLAPGQVTTATATHAITQADLDAGEVRNAATASGTSPAGAVITDPSAAAVTTPTAASAPTIDVRHTGRLAAGSAGVAGDIVEWGYSLTNTGNVTLDTVTLTDPQPRQFAFTYTWPGADGVLAPGQTVTATSRYVLTQADVNSGSVSTTVTGSGTSPTGVVRTATAPATVPVAAYGAIRVDLESSLVSPGIGAVGDVVRFDVVVVNTGNVTLTGARPVAQLEGLYDATVNWPEAPGVLPVGVAITGSSMYRITQADVDRGFVVNSLTINGTRPDGTVAQGASPERTVPTVQAVPSISTTKSGLAAAPAGVGSQVTYTIVSTNTGNVTLTGVTAADQRTGVSALTPGTWPTATAGTLPPATSVSWTATYLLTQADVDAGFTSNIATSTGTPPRGDAVSGSSPLTRVSTQAATPEITVTKTGSLAAGATGIPGDLVTWTYQLVNDGNVTLRGTTFTDPLQGAGVTYTWPDAAKPGVVPPGGIVTATATYPLTQPDIDRGSVSSAVTGRGTPPTGADVSEQATASVTVPNNPLVTIDQTATLTGPGVAGNTITYDFVVVNTGNVTLTQLALAESNPALGGAQVTWPGTSGTLAPGQRATGRTVYTVTQTDVDRGSVVNIESVDGRAPDGSAASATSTRAETPLQSAGPVLTVTKTGALRTANAGRAGMIDYAFRIQNTGNVTISGIILTDSLPGLSTPVISWPSVNGTLAPGQFATGTAAYRITQTDVNTGSVTNTASVNGTPARGTLTPASSQPAVVQTVAAAPAVQVTDRGSLAAGARGVAGDTVTWTYTIRNSGNVRLSAVALSEQVPGITAPSYTWPGAPDVLDPGQTATATATHVLTQDDVDAGAVSSIVDGSGYFARTNATVTGRASATVDVATYTGLVVTQEARVELPGREQPGTGVVGDVIHFDVTITNTGNVTIHDGRLLAPLPGLYDVTINWPNPAKPGFVGPGEVVTGYAHYPITQEDVDRGYVTNVVNVSGLTPQNVVVYGDSNSVTVPTVSAVPSISTTKSGSVAAPGGVGAIVTYTIVTRNTGNVTLTGVTITDPKAGVSTPVTTGWRGAVGTLAPGDSVSSQAAYTLTQADLDRGSVDNTATSTGSAPDGSVVSADSPTATVSTASSAPRVLVTKSGSLPAGAAGVPGDPVTWSYSLQNTGNVTLSGVTLSDPLQGAGGITYSWPDASNPGVLAPNATVTATATYPLTQADIDRGSVTSTVTGRGTPPSGADVTGAAPASVTVASRPVIEDVQSVSVTGSGAVGDRVTFRFEATNRGNVTLTAVDFADSNGLLELPQLTWQDTPGTLSPGRSVVGTSSHTLTQEDIDRGFIANTSSVTGRAPDGSTAADSSDESLVTLQPASPALTLVKTASRPAGAVGDVIDYSFTIRNTGNVTVSAVTLSDPLPRISTPVITWPGATGVLGPQQSTTATASYTITQADVDAGTVRNTASVTGTPARGTAPVAVAEVSTSTAAAAPAIVVTDAGALAPGARGVSGDTVTWSYTLRNSGNVTLTGVALAEQLPRTSAPDYRWPGTAGTLAPGQTVTATATYVLTQSDVDAGSVVSTVDGVGLRGTTQVPGRASATVDIAQTSDLIVTQDARIETPGIGAVGDVIRFDVVVTNTGNVTITNGRPVALLPGIFDVVINWPGTPGTLGAGQSLTGSARYRITQEDVDRGYVTNVVDVAGTRPDGSPVVGASNEETIPTVQPAPAILTSKSATMSGSGDVGDTVTYSLSARNTGNVTLTGVTITDPLPGLSAIAYGTWPSGTDGRLTPGQTITAAATYTITQADKDRRSVTNTAFSTGTAPNGATATDPSDPVLTEASAALPALTVTNRAALAAGSTGVVGDIVNLSYTIRNTGNVTLTGSSLTDPVGGIENLTFGPFPSGTVGRLAPRDVVTATAIHRLTQADIDAGSYINTINAAGTPPTGAQATATDASTVTIGSTVGISIEKTGATVIAGENGLNDAIRFSFTLRNTGNVTLSGVTIGDELPGLSAPSYSWPQAAGRLAPGSVATATATYRITQDDIDRGRVDNMATVTGARPNGTSAFAMSPTATVVTDPGTPSIAVTQSGAVTSGTGGVGSVITYSFVVTNTGNVTLRLVDLQDDLVDISVPDLAFPGTTGILAPGASATGRATYTVTQADVDRGSVSNIASVVGTAPDGRVVRDASPVSTVSTAPSTGRVSATQTASLADGATGRVGDDVVYVYTITNTSNVTLTDVDYSATVGGTTAPTLTWPGTAGTLAPGQALTVRTTHPITQADVDAGQVVNTVSGVGRVPAGTLVRDASPQSVVRTIAAAPAITVTKSGAASGGGIAGSTITWSFTVGNPGNVTLTAVSIEDSLPGVSAITYGTWPSGTVGTLAPNQSVNGTATYTVTQADVDGGSVTNIATASGTAPSGTVTSARSQTAQVGTATPNALISVTKTQALAPGATGRAGDIVRYTYTVTNEGNVTLGAVGIIDDQPRIGAPVYAWPGPAGRLLPRETVTATATYVLTQDDVDRGSIQSRVVTTGSTPTASVVRDDFEASTEITPAPQITVDLENRFETIAQQGQRVVYTYTLANTGSTTLTGVALTNTRPGLSTIDYTWPGTPGTLAPGQTATARSTTVITQADVDARTIVNSAGISGVSPTGVVVTDSDDAALTIAARDELTLSMSVALRSGQSGFPGDILDFSYLATNTGTTTLTGVVITDPRVGVRGITYTWPGEPGVLLPGQSVTATAPWVITPDFAGALVLNTATATGKELASAAVVSDTAQTAIQLPALPIVPGIPGLPGVPVPPPVLAFTGSDPAPLVGGAMLLLLSGLVLMLLATRNRRKEGSS